MALNLCFVTLQAQADPYDQAARAAKNPNLELLDAADLQYLEAFTAPGTFFTDRLCEVPKNSGTGSCTRLPLDYNTPFTEFPVALRFAQGTVWSIQARSGSLPDIHIRHHARNRGPDEDCNRADGWHHQGDKQYRPLHPIKRHGEVSNSVFSPSTMLKC